MLRTTSGSRVLDGRDLDEVLALLDRDPVAHVFVASRIEAAGLEGLTVPLRVAVMGCVVNGPGEAREADLGVASGNGKGQIFVRGEVVKTVPEALIVETLIEEAMRIAEEYDGPSGVPAVATS